MTGPCAPELIPLSRGTAAYFDYLNKTGGIDGTKVEVLWVDSKYELATALAGYERLKGKCIAFWSPMTHALTALKETAARDKIPIQGQTSVTVPFWPPGYLLGSGVTYGEGLTLIAAFLQEGWKETRPIRVALMFSDDTYGRTIYDGGVQRLKEMGIEIVAEEPVLMRATDATSQLLRVAAENPDYIFCNFIAATQGVVLKDRYRLGIKIPVCTAHGSWAEDLVKMAGVEACEGVISARPFPVPEEADLWGCKLRDEIIRDYLPEWAGKPVGVGAGVNTGIIIAEAIRLAQKEVGFDKLTGESLLKFGFERIKDLDTGGLNPPGLTYTPEDHQGSKYNRLIRIVNGEPVVIKGWTEVPRCMAGVSAK
jgi:branched-chain amino acid transport system substrate-binding protein